MTPADFLADFFKYSTGAIYLCSLPNERGGRRPAEICGRGDSARLNTLVLQTWDRKDRGTFFCVNALKPGQARRSKETVCEITCLHCDLDFSKIDMAPDAVLRQLQALEYPPSKIINSGHGLHCYWLLTEALAATEEVVLQAETALRGIADMLAGDPAVAEIARLMRCPFSHNTKNGERLPVKVVSDTGARYELDDLCQWIKGTRVLISRKGATRAADNPFLTASIPVVGPAIDVNARLAAMTYQGTGDASIHATQVSVTAALLSRNVPADEVVRAVLDATRVAAGAAGNKWNWAAEEKAIRGMCNSWTRKKLNGQQSLARRSVGMEELSTMEFKPVSFLVPDLIPVEGVTLICSKPKVGKSWLLYDLCISTATDRDMLGDRRPLQGHALYLALEDSLRRLQSRGEKLLPAWLGPWPQNVRVAVEWPRVDQGGLDQIREWVLSVRAAGGLAACIAIDVLKMIRPAGQDRKAAYDRDYEALVGLRSLAHELGVAIVVAHHTRKLASDDLLDLVSGTLGLSGSADTIIVIERQDSGFVFDVRGRDVEAVQLAATFDKESCRWTIAGDAATARRSTEREAVLSVFRDAGEPLTVELVTSALGDLDLPVTKSRNAVKKILSRMAINGDIRRLKRGRYELPTHIVSPSH